VHREVAIFWIGIVASLMASRLGIMELSWKDHTMETTSTLKNTPPKTNMEPENHAFERETHLPNLHFQVPC